MSGVKPKIIDVITQRKVISLDGFIVEVFLSVILLEISQ